MGHWVTYAYDSSDRRRGPDGYVENRGQFLLHAALNPHGLFRLCMPAHCLVSKLTTVWFYLFLGFSGGQIFAQCTTRRREPFSLECLILQRDLGEGTKCIPPPIVSARGWTLFLHLNLALSNTTGGNYPVSMERRPHFQQRERQTRRYR